MTKTQLAAFHTLHNISDEIIILCLVFVDSCLISVSGAPVLQQRRLPSKHVYGMLQNFLKSECCGASSNSQPEGDSEIIVNSYTLED